MKKTITLLLVLALLCAMPASFAEGLNFDGIGDGEGVIDLNLSGEEKTIFTSDKGFGTSDIVTDENGTVTVTTDFGVTLVCTVPAGIYYLTQDYFHDLTVYNAVYSDPAKVLEQFIEKQMHLNLFTTGGSCIDAFFYVYAEDDTLAKMIGNANDLVQKDAAYVADYLTKVNGVTFEYGMVGNQLWFVTNLVESYHKVVGITYVNGHVVQAYVENIANTDDLNTAQQMLASVSFR